MNRVVEVRQYNLKPGVRARFHSRFVERSLPLLRRSNIDVIAYGPSLHDQDSWYLIRAFSSLSERERVEAAFYSSEEWTRDLRAEVMGEISSYTTVVVPFDERMLEGLRALVPAPDRPAKEDDEAVLRRLNQEYVDAFMNADVGWYQEHLADEFLCVESDGSVLDKEKFLREAAKGPDVSSYRLDNVLVEIVGASADVGLVRAQGAFSRPDRTTGLSLYVDIYVRRGGAWKAIGAQITRRAR
jgi:hypothetical protein